MKNILVLISNPPGVVSAEILRMTIGLTLEDDNKITALLIDDGVYVSLGYDSDKVLGKDIEKPLNMCEMLKINILAHKGSVEDRKVELGSYGISLIDSDEVGRLINETDVTLA